MRSLCLHNVTVDGVLSDIVIREGRIAAIEPAGACDGMAVGGPADDRQRAFTADAARRGDESPAEVLDCQGLTALPAFVNAHCHSGMTLLRGVGGDVRLEEWLRSIWKLEANIDADYIRVATWIAAREMALGGTSAFLDQYWLPEVAEKVLEASGLRAGLSRVLLIGAGVPVERQFDEMEALLEASAAWPSRLRPLVCFHSVYTCDEKTIVRAVEFARRKGLRIQAHLSETRAEVENCKAAHGGLTPVQYLDRLGVPGPDFIAAHALHLSMEDVALLGRAHAHCVHNVNSNLKLASGYRFLMQELREEGANVCLGTDGPASSNNLDMLEAAKTASLLQKAWRDDPTACPAGEIFSIATRGGALAMGLDAGEIRVGALADLMLIDTSGPAFLSPAPVLDNFLYAAHSDCIRSLVVDGKVVMRDRSFEKDGRRVGFSGSIPLEEVRELIRKFKALL